MKKIAKLWAGLVLCLCALLLCGSALAVDVNLVIPESEYGSFAVQRNGTVIETNVKQGIYWYYTVAEGGYRHADQHARQRIPAGQLRGLRHQK